MPAADNPRILLVEDDLDIAAGIGDYLQARGLQVDFAGSAAQDLVEVAWLHHLAFRELQARHAEAFEKVAQRHELRRIGRVVDAVHAGLPEPLERLRRRDIGGNHQLLDQLMAVESFARFDPGDAAHGIEQDAPLR